jgi:hypothetical protein
MKFQTILVVVARGGGMIAQETICVICVHLRLLLPLQALRPSAAFCGSPDSLRTKSQPLDSKRNNI